MFGFCLACEICNIQFSLYVFILLKNESLIGYLLMMLFQLELGLSMLDLLGWFADSRRRAPLQKQETERDWRGLARCLFDA